MGERLAVDPNRTSTLLFGSRHDGLQRSDDSGATWHKVQSFPWRGLGAPQPHHTHGGVSFVIFDPSSGTVGAGSQVIYAGIADAARNHLFRSGDGGRSWQPVAGGPHSDMLPAKAAIASDGTLYVDYCTGLGPNGVDDGAVWKLDTRSGKWTDITPVRGPDAEGGYMGLSIDRRHAGRLAVSTVDRWNHHDTIWLSKDAGLTGPAFASAAVAMFPKCPSSARKNRRMRSADGLQASRSIRSTAAPSPTRPAAPSTGRRIRSSRISYGRRGCTASRKPCRSASPARLRARTWSRASATSTASFTSASTRRRPRHS